MLSIVFAAILIALLFDLLNGMNDAANSIATIVATRVFSPFTAALWAAFWNFAAIWLFGVSVAHTMGEGIVDPARINEYLILAALMGAVVWVWVCHRFGMPISVSHALIGGLIGPVWFAFGSASLLAWGIFKIVLFILLSPLIGLVLGFLMMCLTLLLFRRKQPLRVEGLFKKLQLLSSAVFSLGHGANDAQKTMGIIAILLFSVAGKSEFVNRYLYENTGDFHIPLWLVVTCYSVIALGTILGGRRVLSTIGNGLAVLKPAQGFCAETAGALTLIGTALSGIPVSTTHTITGSIVGVGMTKGMASIRWGTAANIVAAWIFTIPATILLSGCIYLLLSVLLPLA
ncbi:MAG: inorganic phosphate transporter [Culturomica sp.]|jgi:PiT family inorganic phosphate transporter|nr:inorganic phosphate transporter [Culturomica sp.]